jgi:hypothetical protein
VSSNLVEGADDTSEVDAHDIKVRRETEAQKTARLRRAWDFICSTPEGRAVLWDIMAMSGMSGTPLVPAMPDMTAANIGKADLGRELQTKVNSIGKQWALLMLKENI